MRLTGRLRRSLVFSALAAACRVVAALWCMVSKITGSAERLGWVDNDLLSRSDFAMNSMSDKALDKPNEYQQLARQISALMQGESDRIANAANFAALVFQAVPDISWAGFYFHDGKDLVVGPFQGPPACVRIAMGKGVCGVAAQTRESQLVEDVLAFPGHIFCDPNARAEVVVPLVHRNGQLLGVWDVDSATTGRFDEEDLAGMQVLCQQFMHAVDGSA